MECDISKICRQTFPWITRWGEFCFVVCLIIHLKFAIHAANGELMFRMPCDVGKIFTVLIGGHKKKHRGTEKRVREQAARVAWRIRLDWIEAQIPMIQLNQVKPQQALLAYAYDMHTGTPFRTVGTTKLSINAWNRQAMTTTPAAVVAKAAPEIKGELAHVGDKLDRHALWQVRFRRKRQKLSSSKRKELC